MDVLMAASGGLRMRLALYSPLILPYQRVFYGSYFGQANYQ